MFYTPEILCIRKNGKLARVWLAATLSKRLFKQSVSNRVLLSVNIEAVCIEILRIVSDGGSGEKTIRFSLYLSSQLMYGAVKLLNYQTTLLQSSMFKIHDELITVDDTFKRKKRRTTSDITIADPIDLPNPPPITQILKNITLRDDVHRLPEAELETIRTGRARVYVESLSFGALTDEQVDLLMVGDFRLQELYDRDQGELSVPTRYGAEDTNRLHGSPRVPRLIEQQHQDVNEDSRAIENVEAVREGEKPVETPKKRVAMAPNADTPSKRRRRNLGSEFNEVAGERTDHQMEPPVDLPDERPIDVPANIPVPLPIDQPANIPQDIPAEPPIDQPADVPADPTINPEFPQPSHLEETEDTRNLQLQTLELTSPRRPKTTRVRKRIDANISLSTNVLKRQTQNITAHTVTIESRQIVSQNICQLPAISLLKKPSNNIRTTLYRRSRYFKWASQLYRNFRHWMIGPFHADDDVSMNAEVVRAADSRMQPHPEEISSGLGRAGLESSSTRDKTGDEPTAEEAELINLPVMPGIPEDDQPPITNVGLHEITHEPILENTMEADTISVSKHPESNERADPADAGVANVASTSDPDVEVEAFLPREMRTKTIVKKEKVQKKKTSSDDTIDLRESQSSIRSEVSLQSAWTKYDLWATLEVHWRDYPVVKLNQLLSTDTTKLDAATCFTLLLELSHERKTRLAQAKPYDDIYITKITVIPDDGNMK